MLTVIIAMGGVASAAVAVTVYAFVTAKNGFEDEEGFHAVVPTPDSSRESQDKENSTLTSFFPEARPR